MITEALKNLIKQFEGLHDGDKKTPHLQPQMDPVGIWTIGWGHAIRSGGRNLTGSADRLKALSLFPALTLQEAEKMLEVDLQYYIDIVLKLVTSKITQNQKDALTSLVYNIGGSNFSSSSLLRMINTNPNDSRISGKFAEWRLSGNPKRILPGLVLRREKEATLYFKK